MDAVRLVNKALSDADIQRILGGDTKIIKYSELAHLYDIDQLLPGERKTSASSFTRTVPTEGTGLRFLNTVVSTSTLTHTVSSQTAS